MENEMLTDERYKQLMKDVALPNSRSLLAALKQVDMEATLIERERCLAIVADTEEFDEDMPDDVWKALNLDRISITEALRISVRLTKTDVKKRISRWGT